VHFFQSYPREGAELHINTRLGWKKQPMMRRSDGSCAAERIEGIRLDSGLAELCIVDADRQRISCLNESVKSPGGYDNIVFSIAADGTPAVVFPVRVR